MGNGSVQGGSTKAIEQKSWLKLLGTTFQDNPRSWDLHVNNLLSEASGRMYTSFYSFMHISFMYILI